MKLGMNIHLKPELRQKLAITPLLKQSLELLTLNLLELDHMIIQEFEENPLLKDSNYSEQTKDSHEEDEAPEIKTEDIEEKYEIDEEVWANVFNELPREAGVFSHNGAMPGLEQMNALKPTLKEHLEWQLRLSVEDKADLEIGMNIIGNLDANGFISCSELNNIAEKLNVSLDKVNETRSVIQSFDPLGIASTNIPECLLAQLKAHGFYHKTIEALLVKHFESIKISDFNPILNDRELGLSADDLKFILNILSNLDPRPGCHFDDREDRNIDIIPDIIISYEEGEYAIELNESIRPMLYIPDNYRNLLLSKSPELEKDKEFLKKKLARAQWLLKSIEQRRSTLMKVGNAFIKFQRDFLDKGKKFIKPMILKDIAEECGIHASTVQRIVNQKYIDTPRGTFLLKFFFTRAIPTKAGEPVSNMVIKKEIETIITDENKESPLSDAEIQSIIQKKGIKLSRRVISKYRAELGILNSNKRKIKKL